MRAAQSTLLLAVATIVACTEPYAPEPLPPMVEGSWTGEVRGLRLQLEIVERPDGADSRSLSGSGWLFRSDGADSVEFALFGLNSRNFTPPALFNLTAPYLGSQTWAQVRCRLISPDTLLGEFVPFPDSPDYPQWLSEVSSGVPLVVAIQLARE